MEDPIDQIRREMAEADPALDTRGLAITGRILILARRIDELREEVLSEFGLSQGDYDVLATLRRREGDAGLNPKELQQLVMISSGGLTKRLDRLEAAELIKRGPDPGDRRGVRVRLTAGGRRLFNRALPAVLTAEQQLVHRALGSEAEGQLVELLRTMLLRHAEGAPDGCEE